jgi:hypothetical protein
MRMPGHGVVAKLVRADERHAPRTFYAQAHSPEESTQECRRVHEVYPLNYSALARTAQSILLHRTVSSELHYDYKNGAEVTLRITSS